jgi:hypothetical protein
VANVGNGVVEMLRGTNQGLEVIETFREPGAPHISDLAVVAVGNGFDVYGTIAGREVAVLLGTFGVDVTPIFLVPPSPGFNEAIVIVLTDPPFTNVNVDLSFVVALPSFALPPTNDVNVQVAANTNPFSDTGVVPDSAEGGYGAEAVIWSNPSRILFRNINDPFPRSNTIPRGFEEEEEDECGAFLAEELLNVEPAKIGSFKFSNSNVATPLDAVVWESMNAEPDFTVPPIALYEVPGGTRSPGSSPIVIELQPQRNQETKAGAAESSNSVHAASATGLVDSTDKSCQAKLSDVLGMCSVVPLVLSHWLDQLRPTWTKLQLRLRKIFP